MKKDIYNDNFYTDKYSEIIEKYLRKNGFSNAVVNIYYDNDDNQFITVVDLINDDKSNPRPIKKLLNNKLSKFKSIIIQTEKADNINFDNNQGTYAPYIINTEEDNNEDNEANEDIEENDYDDDVNILTPDNIQKLSKTEIANFLISSESPDVILKCLIEHKDLSSNTKTRVAHLLNTLKGTSSSTTVLKKDKYEDDEEEEKPSKKTPPKSKSPSPKKLPSPKSKLPSPKSKASDIEETDNMDDKIPEKVLKLLIKYKNEENETKRKNISDAIRNGKKFDIDEQDDDLQEYIQDTYGFYGFGSSGHRSYGTNKVNRKYSKTKKTRFSNSIKRRGKLTKGLRSYGKNIRKRRSFGSPFAKGSTGNIYGIQDGPKWSGVYPMNLKVEGTEPNLYNVQRKYNLFGRKKSIDKIKRKSNKQKTRRLKMTSKDGTKLKKRRSFSAFRPPSPLTII